MPDLDHRLDADTVPLAAWPLCDVRLMNDARFPWIVLVPRRAGAVEPFDLPREDEALLWAEAGEIARRLRRSTGAAKINIGMLGNIVSQLHVHVVARRPGDAAWPGPVWGSGERAPYCDVHLPRLREAYASLFAMQEAGR